MLAPILQPLLRRGGIFHGPRLIFAVLAVFILIFYFSSPSSSPVADYSQRPVGDSDPARGGKDIVQEYTEHSKDKDDSLSNKFFDYLGHRKSPPKPSATATTSVAPKIAPTSGASILTATEDPICDGLAKAAQDILVVVDAPATDLHTILSSRLLTHLRCAPVSIFSTVSLKLGVHTVHDALTSVSKETKSKHSSAFNHYLNQHKAQEIFQDLTGITGGTAELGKWTIIPALIESYKMNPEKKFFIVITPTTYLSIPNLLAWLPNLSPSTPMYVGAQRGSDGMEVAALSTGILLSQAAVANLATMYGERKLAWEENASKRSTPDAVLGEALSESGVPLSHGFPTFQGGNLLNTPFNNATWCKAPVGWGGMTPALMDLMWDFDRNWTVEHMDLLIPPVPVAVSTTTSKGRFWKRAAATAVPTDMPANTYDTEDSLVVDQIGPVAPTIPEYHYSHLLNKIVAPILLSTPNRTMWDNGANTYKIDGKSKQSGYGHSQFDRCSYACDVRSKCIMYVYESNECRMANWLRLGSPATGKTTGPESGWIFRRVSDYINGLSCEKNSQPFPQPKEVRIKPASMTIPGKVENKQPAPEVTATATVEEELEVDEGPEESPEEQEVKKEEKAEEKKEEEKPLTGEEEPVTKDEKEEYSGAIKQPVEEKQEEKPEEKETPKPPKEETKPTEKEVKVEAMTAEEEQER